MNINHDLLEYFNGDLNGHPFLEELDRAKVKHSIISILEQRCGYPHSVALYRRQIPDLYEVLAQIYRIPFPSYLLRLLYSIEERATLYPKYRDHILHLFYVFCLGCYIFDNSTYYKSLENLDSQKIMANWILASFLHDLGYIFCEDEFDNKYRTGAELERVVRCGTGDIFESFDLFWTWLLTITINGQPEFAVPGSAANAIQKVDIRALELAFPTFWSTVERCCRFDQYNSQDLFEELPLRADMMHFSNADIDIRNFLNTSGRLNHGIVSSLILVYILKARNTLLSSRRMPNEIIDIAHRMDEYCSIDRFQEGIWSIALHDLKTLYTGASVKLSEAPPLISLLLIADGLQCWDRQYFRQENNSLRMPLPSDAIGLQLHEDDISWCYDENYSSDPGYINASYNSIVLGECAAFLSSDDVKSLIKKYPND